MAGSGTLAAGTATYSSTIAAASTAEAVAFADRYDYFTVVNAGSDALYVRADGTAATVGGEDCYLVPAGTSQLLANALPTWYQSSTVIPAGEIEYGNGNTAESPGAPGEITPMTSLAGQMADPGTSVSLISSTAGGAYSVEAAG